MSWPLIKYVLTAAIRDRLIFSLVILVAVGVSLSFFLGSSAIMEQDQFALVFAAGGLRMAGMAGLVLFVVFFVRRAFDAREVEYLLSSPVSRVRFILSLAAAFSLLATLLAGIIMLAVTTMLPSFAGEGHMLWGFSLLTEFIIMVNTALFFAMVLPSAASGALATLAFYVLARLIGQILGILGRTDVAPVFDWLGKVMEFISIFIPRLDLMGQTSWLVYGNYDGSVSFGFIILQGAVFGGFIILAATVDLLRKQF